VIALEDLKAWLGVTGTDSDALLTALEARAVDFVQRETGRYFGIETERVELIRGDGSDTLGLRERPELESESVAGGITLVESRALTAESWTAIADTEWELHLPMDDTGILGGALYRMGDVWRRDTRYRVTYDFGYVVGAEPGEIRQAVIDIVELKYLERGRFGLRGETLGDYSYTLGQRDIENVPDLMGTLNRWRGAPVFV
jgi:hypothetical protein